MRSFHNPAASAVAGLGSFRLGFFSSLLDMRLVAISETAMPCQADFS